MVTENAGSHAGHSHGHTQGIPLEGGSAVKGLIAGIALNLVIVFVEIIIGLMADSLSLLSDAIHNFTDMAALSITWFALAQAKKPPTAARTFGHHRIGIATALINSIAMVLVTMWIFYEAWQRFMDPQPVGGLLVMITAAVALGANLAIVAGLRSHASHDINIRSAILHLIGDAAASAAVIVSGAVIIITQWYPVDPLVSVLLGLLILWGAWQIIRETVEIFLEQSPRAVDVDEVVEDLKREAGVRDIHDIHIWTLGSGIYALSCHVLVDDVMVSESSRIVTDLKRMLRDDFGITHSTIEVESVACDVEGPYCKMSNGHLVVPTDLRDE
jgi:cobalt-zinc-cadmium efflux system protein